MTANAIKGDRERCLAAGMNDYLTKPMDVRVLEATIGRWVQPQPSKLADLPPFDADAMQSRFGHDRELEQMALATFRQATPPLLAKMRAALAAGQRKQLGLHAHSAKGGASMISADRYAAIAARLEERAAIAPEEDLRQLLEDLQRAFDAFELLAAAR